MAVAPGFASAGDLETAIILLSQMRRLNIQPDSILFNTILYLSCILCHLCHPFSYCDFVVEGILDSFSHFCGLTNKVPSEEWMCQAADEGSD